MRVPKKVKAPRGKYHDFIISGNEYFIEEAKNGFYYIDVGKPVFIPLLLKNSCWINGKDWIVTEWQEIN